MAVGMGHQFVGLFGRRRHTSSFGTIDGRSYRSACVACDQKGQRIDGPFLQPSLSAADNRTEIFHGVWAVGTAGYGGISFAKAIIEGAPIKLFNHGKMRRDFTYIDDVARVVLRLIDHVPQGSEGRAVARRRGFIMSAIITRNQLLHVVAVLEKELGREAVKQMLPMQPGDIHGKPMRYDDLNARWPASGRRTSIEEGFRDFVGVYRDTITSRRNLRTPMTGVSFH